MDKPLVIPNNKKVKGLTVFCKARECRTNVSDTCPKTGKKILGCPHPDRQVFKSYIYEPNTGIRRTKEFLTRNINEAVQMAVQFEKDVKEGKFQTVSLSMRISPTQPSQEMLLVKMAEFADFLRGKVGPAHTRRSRSENHCRDVERSFVLFGKAMKKNKIDPEKLRLNEIDQTKVGFYHSYLISKGYAGRTYNRHIANLRGLYNYLVKYGELEIRNPFNMVQKRATHTEILTIETDEFLALMDAIKPEDSVQALSTGEKKYHWHPFLKTAFSLSLMAGIRREQLVKLKYKNIREDKEGRPCLIESANLKVNRIMGEENEDNNKRMIYIPVTESLRNFLIEELEYQNNRGSDKFLIAPDSKLDRMTLMNILSKSFTHFWKKAGINKDLKFSDLRKTYLSRMALVMGDKLRYLTNHSSSEILGKHYINQELFARAASNSADLFPEIKRAQEQRENEIKQARNQKEIRTNSREI